MLRFGESMLKMSRFLFAGLLLHVCWSRVGTPEHQEHQSRYRESQPRCQAGRRRGHSIAEIRKAAPDFRPASVVVTATDAATLEEDAATLQTIELPSQVDDLDADGKGDELAFQIDLSPHQTRVVTISYGTADRIWRLRRDYAPRTNAFFSRKIEGLGWESDRVAFRIYFDPRNAIDIYGKAPPNPSTRHVCITRLPPITMNLPWAATFSRSVIPSGSVPWCDCRREAGQSGSSTGSAMANRIGRTGANRC